VDEVMPVRVAGREGGAIARVHHRRALVLDERAFALGHHHELVLVPVPVAERGFRARFEDHEVCAELRQPARVAEAERRAAPHLGRIGFGVDGPGLHRAFRLVDDGHHTLSMIVAAPMPDAMQSVASPVPLPVRSSSSRSVPMMIAPVAPRGWPMAIAPPLTLTRSGETSKACMKRRTTLAKASLTSKRSMSEIAIPESLRIFSVTGTGPVSMIVGSVPIFAVARMRARGVRPCFSPNALLPISTAAAPSTMPEELPAWWMWLIRSRCGYFISATLSKPGITSPMSLNEGFSAPSVCMSVPGRMYSSRSRIGSPFWSRMVITDFAKRFSSQAFAARFCDSTASASASSRAKPYSVAMMSAEMPCGTK